MGSFLLSLTELAKARLASPLRPGSQEVTCHPSQIKLSDQVSFSSIGSSDSASSLRPGYQAGSPGRSPLPYSIHRTFSTIKTKGTQGLIPREGAASPRLAELWASRSEAPKPRPFTNQPNLLSSTLDLKKKVKGETSCRDRGGNVQGTYWAAIWGNMTVKQWGSRAGQWESLSCRVVATVASPDPSGSSGAGMAFQSCPRLR